MKRKVLFLLVALLLFAFPSTADAAITLHSMDIDVYLNPNGNGDVTVLWDSTQDDTGTENYIPIGNLGDSTIENFRVSEEGVNYTENPNWDVDLSREQKTGTYGVIDKADGVELAWGIGKPVGISTNWNTRSRGLSRIWTMHRRCSGSLSITICPIRPNKSG